MLLAVYLLTLAPGVTFWDAGEFIAAADGFGIPHPPGTPLYVAMGRVTILAIGWLTGAARAMNLLSALATALAGAITALLIAQETRASNDGYAWGAAAAGLLGGTMYSVWSNATETEVYAIALLHVVAMMACAARADDSPRGARWTLLTAYLIALAPAVHLSALVGAPAAIALAMRSRDGDWSVPRGVLLTGVLVAGAGVGRMSAPLVVAGAVCCIVGRMLSPRAAVSAAVPPGRRQVTGAAVLLIPLAASALCIMLVRARHDPAINQGNPSTVTALADVVARRQYDVAPMLPRRAPLWVQAANVAQYTDWQVAMGWGRGIHTTPGRVLAALVFVALAIVGWRAMRRESARLTLALSVLLLCGTLGIAVYLNMRAGASLGWGVLPDTTPHEARERDYFFVLGFWAWACLAAWGALHLARRVRRPWLALLVAIVPLIANWRAVDRSREPEAGAPRRFALAMLADLPPRALLFVSGDNDSYPLWYLQQVERTRPDVQLVTLPLLPADWYEQEIARRSHLRWGLEPVPGTRWQHEATAARIAAAAHDAGRPVLASVALTAGERDLLGSGWTLRGASYQSTAGRSEHPSAPDLDTAHARAWVARLPTSTVPADDRPDGVTHTMLALLECPRLALPWRGTAGGRDSLEVRCNFR